MRTKRRIERLETLAEMEEQRFDRVLATLDALLRQTPKPSAYEVLCGVREELQRLYSPEDADAMWDGVLGELRDAVQPGDNQTDMRVVSGCGQQPDSSGLVGRSPDGER